MLFKNRASLTKGMDRVGTVSPHFPRNDKRFRLLMVVKDNPNFVDFFLVTNSKIISNTKEREAHSRLNHFNILSFVNPILYQGLVRLVIVCNAIDTRYEIIVCRKGKCGQDFPLISHNGIN